MNTNHDDEEAPRSRARLLGGTAGLLAIPLAVIWWPGCREYPAVTSREGMYQMQLLYAAANTKDPARLAAVERGLEGARIGIGAELVSEDLRLAARCLGRITGSIDAEDLLDRIFSQFCVGK